MNIWGHVNNPLNVKILLNRTNFVIGWMISGMSRPMTARLEVKRTLLNRLYKLRWHHTMDLEHAWEALDIAWILIDRYINDLKIVEVQEEIKQRAATSDQSSKGE